MTSRAALPTKKYVSEKKRKIFIKKLAQTGSVTESAKAVGWKTNNSAYLARRTDEDFAQQWQNALDEYAGILEEEADRRAVEGILDPIYYKGKIVGYKREYSDALLQFRLRGLKPEVYNQQKDNKIDVNFGIAVMPMQAPDEKDWEGRAIDMQTNQPTIEIEEAPQDNLLEERNRQRVQRGD